MDTILEAKVREVSEKLSTEAREQGPLQLQRGSIVCKDLQYRLMADETSDFELDISHCSRKSRIFSAIFEAFKYGLEDFIE